MKITEILSESYMDPQIRKILVRKGYKFLGKGVDQMAFLAPDGWILKIFGSTSRSGNRGLSQGQRAFKAFADYCMANPSNPFLPNFGGWETFEFEGRTYLQIRVERLFPFQRGSGQGWGRLLELLADYAQSSTSTVYKNQSVRDIMGSRNGAEFLSYLGQKGFNTLYQTISDLSGISRKNGFGGLDLHSGNFMLGSDGHVVISDPFYVGEEW